MKITNNKMLIKIEEPLAIVLIFNQICHAVSDVNIGNHGTTDTHCSTIINICSNI
jgi:hypothetical protein